MGVFFDSLIAFSGIYCFGTLFVFILVGQWLPPDSRSDKIRYKH